MNAPQSPAARTRTLDPAEEPAAEETLTAHAKRALRTKVRARVTAVLDAGIAFLQKLRKKAGDVQDAEEDEDNPGSRRDRPRPRNGATVLEAAAEAPKPKRRLRAFLIYLSVLLAGGMAGGALSYTQFQKQLGRQLKESQRLEAELAKKTRPSAEIRKAFEDEQARRAHAEKKLASSLAEYSESTAHSYALLETLFGQQFAESRRLEAALAENAKSSAEVRKALGEEQARRTEAEGKLAESSKSLTEKQRQLDATEKQLAKLLADEGAHNVSKMEASSHRSTSYRTPRPSRSGSCTLDAENLDSLKGCINDFNR